MSHRPLQQFIIYLHGNDRQMIEKGEISAQSTSLGVSHADVERDYVFGWLLKGFYENNYLSNVLILKGGNNVRKAYFPDARFSNDLDFSIQDAIDLNAVQREINQTCSIIQGYCGVEFDINRNTLTEDRSIDEHRFLYKGRIYFKDFYGNPDSIIISIKVDITEFDRLSLPIITRPLIHNYSDGKQCTSQIRCMALEEHIANKLKCLIQRRHSFDLYDIVYAAFFQRSIQIDRRLILETFLKKAIFLRNPGAVMEILLGLPMPFFRKAWGKYISPISSRISIDSAESGFRDAIRAIFEGISPYNWSMGPFFPSQYRNLIMDAGLSRRLLLLTYSDGRKREVEPYSLTYKRTKKGDASEYFYAWDRTGGKRPPGIRTFLRLGVKEIEISDQQFEPRYPIELAKSGEYTNPQSFTERSLHNGSSLRRTQNRKQRSDLSNVTLIKSFNSTTYSLKCPVCGKVFRKKFRSNTLNRHKNVYGIFCTARTGYFV